MTKKLLPGCSRCKESGTRVPIQIKSYLDLYYDDYGFFEEVDRCIDDGHVLNEIVVYCAGCGQPRDDLYHDAKTDLVGVKDAH